MNTRTVLTTAIVIALLFAFGLLLIPLLISGMGINLSHILVPRFFGTT